MKAAVERLLAPLDAWMRPPDDQEGENDDLESSWAGPTRSATGKHHCLSTEDREHEHCGGEPEEFQ